MMHRELARLKVHNPGSPNATDIGVFASPTFARRDSTEPSAPRPCKKRARLTELGDKSPERGDILVSTEEIMQEQILTLQCELRRMQLVIQILIVNIRQPLH
jgi:hypothetical protein